MWVFQQRAATVGIFKDLLSYVIFYSAKLKCNVIIVCFDIVFDNKANALVYLKKKIKFKCVAFVLHIN